MRKFITLPLKFFITLLAIFGIVSALLYYFTAPQQDRNWALEHKVLPRVQIQEDEKNPKINVTNTRDFKWSSENKVQYKDLQFHLENIVELKAVVSHFSAISEIAHVFIIFVLDDGQELGVSIEARREVDEPFSIQGGLLAQFEIMYVLATPEDLLGIRKINGDVVHVYPIKETKEKAQDLFLLIAKEVNTLYKEPALYHLFFKNCTNQLVKNVSILTEQKYPWYFQTLAPGLTGKTLYDLNLIDLNNLSFDEVQAKTLVN